MTNVKFCEYNFSMDPEYVADKIKENHPTVNVSIEPFLDQCEDCPSGPFALVNEQYIVASGVDELYDKIAEEITQ